MNNKIAELYIQGEICKGKLLRIDSKTYISELYVFEILDGRFQGETVAIFKNGDKFRRWIN